MTSMLSFRGLVLESHFPPVDLEVPRHSTVAVRGAPESGVLKLGSFALGMERPEAGTVVVLEEDPSEMSRRELLDFRRRIGYLPLGDGLLQNLSLRDNIALPLRFGSEMTERQISGRVQIILAAVGIGERADLRPSQASEELRRRAALARALAFDPDLVILEQPFDGVTNRTALELVELARGGTVPQGSRRTLLLVGHSLPEVVRSRFDFTYRLARSGFRKED